MGEVGIAPGHTQLLAALKPGDIRAVLTNGEELLFYVSGGFLEIQPSMATVLSDTVIRAEDLDEEAILLVKQAAEAILHGKPEELEYAKALSELAASAAQLQVLAKLRKRRS
jgi:F-type H+-transporting ATPase subunit epsilon